MSSQLDYNPFLSYPKTGQRLMVDFVDFNRKESVTQKTTLAEDKDVRGSTQTGEAPILRVSGILQEAEIRNENFRIYPRQILSCAIKEIQEDIDARALYGEFGHPENAKINMERISHINTKASMDGNVVRGVIEVLDNQVYGRSLRGLFERKCRVCTSSRGLGEVEELFEHRSGEKSYVVQPDYHIICWDMVADPSVRRAVLKPLNEQRNRIIKAAQEEHRHTGKFITEEAVTNRILDCINKYLGIRDIGPRPKSRG